jgi:hypothetical protein
MHNISPAPKELILKFTHAADKIRFTEICQTLWPQAQHSPSSRLNVEANNDLMDEFLALVEKTEFMVWV